MNNLTTILLVDDHEANRDTLRELLDTPEFRFVDAADGSTALQLAAASPPDLVLLDVMMPGMDGFEVCRRLRADVRLAEVPVIMVTALDDQESRLAGLEAGADDFISKPYNRLELRARVRTVARLNRYRRLDDQRRQFHWIAEHAPEGYVLVNAEDEILFANGRARLWLGLDPNEGDGEEGQKFLPAARRIFRPQPAELWVGWPNQQTDLETDHRLLVRPETPQAKATFLEVSAFDSSAGRLLRLHDATERLGGRRDQRTFQTMVYHKLRTPLKVLVGCLKLLEDETSLSPAEIADFTYMMHRGADGLCGAVEEVLRFADLTKQPRFTLADLNELVETASAYGGYRVVSVHIESNARDAVINCSAETLRWVLIELLENAQKFHPSHSPAVQVDARWQDPHTVIITVTDDGRTLSSEQLASACRPYVQDEKNFTGEIPGMGLGLAYVSLALWQAGGSCHLDNRDDRPGLRVELAWPSQPTPAAANSLTTNHHSL